jgi:toxin ParE1/3/4
MIVSFTVAALDDLAAVKNFIGTNSPRAAEEAVSTLLRSAQSLAVLPSRGRPGRVPGTREMVVPPYIIVYTVNAERLVVVRIVHGAQKWP